MEIASKNRIRHAWQKTPDHKTKRQLNGKIKFIRTLLQTPLQDVIGYQKQLYLQTQQKLLNNTTTIHSLSSPNSLLFNLKTKLTKLNSSLIPINIKSPRT